MASDGDGELLAIPDFGVIAEMRGETCRRVVRAPYLSDGPIAVGANGRLWYARTDGSLGYLDGPVAGKYPVPRNARIGELAWIGNSLYASPAIGMSLFAIDGDGHLDEIKVSDAPGTMSNIIGDTLGTIFVAVDGDIISFNAKRTAKRVATIPGGVLKLAAGADGIWFTQPAAVGLVRLEGTFESFKLPVTDDLQGYMSLVVAGSSAFAGGEGRIFQVGDGGVTPKPILVLGDGGSHVRAMLQTGQRLYFGGDSNSMGWIELSRAGTVGAEHAIRTEQVIRACAI